MKKYSVNMLIALFTDIKEDGTNRLSESDVLNALISINRVQPRLVSRRLKIVNDLDKPEDAEVGVGEYQAKPLLLRRKSLAPKKQ